MSTPGDLLELRWEPGILEVDAVAAHRDALPKQQLLLLGPFWQSPVCTDDALPGDVGVRLRQDETHEPRRTGIDVAVGAHKPFRDRTDAFDDSVRARCRLHRTAISRRGPDATRPRT